MSKPTPKKNTPNLIFFLRISHQSLLSYLNFLFHNYLKGGLKFIFMKSKIKSQKELLLLIEQLKQQGKRIVTTNGAFDILHTAHLHFLEKAKSLGDILIVLVNDDASVKHFKGEKRPILNENERTLHLAYLTPVDYLSLFPEES